MSKLSLTLHTFSVTGLVAGLFLTSDILVVKYALLLITNSADANHSSQSFYL